MRWPLLGDRRAKSREPDLSEVRATSAQLRRIAHELDEARRQTKATLDLLMARERRDA